MVILFLPFLYILPILCLQSITFFILPNPSYILLSLPSSSSSFLLFNQSLSSSISFLYPSLPFHQHPPFIHPSLLSFLLYPFTHSSNQFLLHINPLPSFLNYSFMLSLSSYTYTLPSTPSYPTSQQGLACIILGTTHYLASKPSP